MIKNTATLTNAKKLAIEDDELLDSLCEWHERRGDALLQAQDRRFSDWLTCMLLDMSDRIGVCYPEFPSAGQIVEALRVNAIGDFVAVKASEIEERAGMESDINCYVEDGIVFSRIWIKGADSASTRERAESLAAKLNGLGYSAEVYVDEEDDCEATVNAQLDFPLYLKMKGTGVNPECLLCNKSGAALKGLGEFGIMQYIEGRKERMSDSEIEERVKNAIVETLGANRSEIVPQTTFISLGADSLDMVDVIICTEAEFGVAISDEDADKIETVGDLVNCVKNLVS